MGNRVFLNIETKNGLVMIPFLGLKELDYFTIGFENDEQLITSLSKMLDLSLNVEDVFRIYITGNRYKDTKNSSLLCIKYREDNYNIESLKEMFSLYLKQDHRRIKNCDIRFVVTKGMVDFIGGKSISDHDIDCAVDAFLKKDYKKQRDVYFMIKDFASIRVDKLGKVERSRTELNMLDAEEDSFVQNLIECASRGEDVDRILDEMALIDLEDISRVLSGSKKDIFDGLTDEEVEDLEDVYSLEALTGMSLEEIKKFQTGYNFGNGFRR